MRVHDVFTFVICALATSTIGAAAYAQATDTPAAPAQATSEAPTAEQHVAANYLADATDTVNLTVVMAALHDGTGYPSTIKIDTPSEAMSVAITNSGYQKRAN